MSKGNGDELLIFNGDGGNEAQFTAKVRLRDKAVLTIVLTLCSALGGAGGTKVVLAEHNARIAAAQASANNNTANIAGVAERLDKLLTAMEHRRHAEQDTREELREQIGKLTGTLDILVRQVQQLQSRPR